ncbi:hypothetical protein [Laceyella sacchari]|jgi:hypothetical protein|uniref:Uncharacterized protein n=1 Tax=Laceyella sacchari TaxID=37482 RepID=A0ABY5U111_LACSH|nr:hypothetical protein [Laceyella sacchari]TCW39029.1 hypothetical protein EDC32_102270 [Laceyella sacchari]UWE03341.1 hypothetical protein NYR52_14695 [Laceyella sacchari]
MVDDPRSRMWGVGLLFLAFVLALLLKQAFFAHLLGVGFAMVVWTKLAALFPRKLSDFSLAQKVLYVFLMLSVFGLTMALVTNRG